MTVRCINCLPEEGITIPDFTPVEKKELTEQKQISPLRSVLYLKEHFNLPLLEAKYIALHINAAYGHCNRCNSKLPGEEYTNCPRCGSLNFNWKINYQQERE